MLLKNHLIEVFKQASLENNFLLKENVVLKWVHRFGIDSLNDLLIYSSPQKENKCEEENQEQTTLMDEVDEEENQEQITLMDEVDEEENQEQTTLMDEVDEEENQEQITLMDEVDEEENQEQTTLMDEVDEEENQEQTTLMDEVDEEENQEQTTLMDEVDEEENQEQTTLMDEVDEEENQAQIKLELSKTFENIEKTKWESNGLETTSSNGIYSKNQNSNKINLFTEAPKLPLPEIKNLRKWINNNKKAS